MKITFWFAVVVVIVSGIALFALSAEGTFVAAGMLFEDI